MAGRIQNVTDLRSVANPQDYSPTSQQNMGIPPSPVSGTAEVPSGSFSPGSQSKAEQIRNLRKRINVLIEDAINLMDRTTEVDSQREKEEILSQIEFLRNNGNYLVSVTQSSISRISNLTPPSSINLLSSMSISQGSRTEAPRTTAPRVETSVPTSYLQISLEVEGDQTVPYIDYWQDGYNDWKAIDFDDLETLPLSTKVITTDSQTLGTLATLDTQGILDKAYEYYYGQEELEEEELPEPSTYRKTTETIPAASLSGPMVRLKLTLFDRNLAEEGTLEITMPASSTFSAIEDYVSREKGIDYRIMGDINKPQEEVDNSYTLQDILGQEVIEGNGELIDYYLIRR